jgi:hypothetical protein
MEVNRVCRRWAARVWKMGNLRCPSHDEKLYLNGVYYLVDGTVLGCDVDVGLLVIAYSQVSMQMTYVSLGEL